MMRKPVFAALVFTLMLTAPSITQAQQTARGEWDDLARFLAGMSIPETSVYHELTRTGVYRDHAREMESFWRQVLRENIFNIIPWRNTHVMPHYDYGTAFYPLSGGDFINLYLLYPLARRYIMVSMEPPGAIPSPLDLTANQLRHGLMAVRGTIRNIAVKNYMMSAVMKYGMKNPYLEGTLPVCLIFAARLELIILGIEPVGLSEKGLILPLDVAGKVEGKSPHALGNRITFKASETGPAREILYLRMRLGGESMNQASPEGKFFNTLNDLNVIIKSAFYLLHRAGFDVLCRSLLSRTRMLIQDDSGIPYSLLNPDDFNITLYGYYNRPLALNDMRHPVMQQDLADAFRVNPRSLPFDFGYGVWRRDKLSNLLLAVRKKNIPARKGR